MTIWSLALNCSSSYQYLCQEGSLAFLITISWKAAGVIQHLEVLKRLCKKCSRKRLVHVLQCVISQVTRDFTANPVINTSNTEHVQGLGANGKAAFSPKAHG